MTPHDTLFSVYVDGMVSGIYDNKTQEQIAKILKVDRKTIYAWKQKADWKAITDARRKLYAHEILKIDKAMLKEANRGDVPAAKLAYERFDGWVPMTGLKLSDATTDELLARAKKIKEEILNGRVGPDIAGTGPEGT
jgi:transposase